MNLRQIVLTACGMILLGGATHWAQDAPPAAGAAREIQMTAKKYEFNPSTVTVKKDERVKLVITALDKDHGIKIEAFGIKQVLKKEEATTIEFTADKAGEFPFECAKFCGFGHGKMKGKLVVEE